MMIFFRVGLVVGRMFAKRGYVNATVRQMVFVHVHCVCHEGRRGVCVSDIIGRCRRAHVSFISSVRNNATRVTNYVKG